MERVLPASRFLSKESSFDRRYRSVGKNKRLGQTYDRLARSAFPNLPDLLAKAKSAASLASSALSFAKIRVEKGLGSGKKEGSTMKPA